MSVNLVICDFGVCRTLVLMMGFVVYAHIDWSCKIRIILLLPTLIMPTEPESEVLQEQHREDNKQVLKEQQGSEYWFNDDTHSELEQSKAEQKAADDVK